MCVMPFMAARPAYGPDSVMMDGGEFSSFGRIEAEAAPGIGMICAAESPRVEIIYAAEPSDFKMVDGREFFDYEMIRL